jgi:hypothetical protein
MLYAALALFAVLVAGLDQLCKYLVVHGMSLGETGTLLPGILRLHYVRNSGMAWSMLSGKDARWFFVAATAVFLAVIVVLIWKKFIAKPFELFLSCSHRRRRHRQPHRPYRHPERWVDMLEFSFVDFPVFKRCRLLHHLRLCCTVRLPAVFRP